MATAKRAFGTLLRRETTPSSGTFTTIGGLTGLNFPGMETDVAESTDMEAASATRTRVPTLNNLGECSGNLNFDSSDATQEQMMADCAAQAIRLYQIAASDTGTCFHAFNAYVTRFVVTADRDGLITAAFTLTPTGVVTRTT